MVAQENWLKQLVGRWSYSLATTADSEFPGFTSTGTEVVTSIGDTWVVMNNNGNGSDGTPSKASVIIGFESEKGRFTGAHAGTAVPVLFIFDGELDAEGRLVLETEGPAMTEGKATDWYRDVLTIIDADTREQSQQVLDAMGNWKEFMLTRFKRA